MIRFLKTKWLVVVTGTLAYAVTTWFCLQPQKQIEQAVATLRALQGTPSTAKPGPSWTFHNPEMSQIVSELKDERQALRVRASQLDELAARLLAERQEIYAVTQVVYQVRAEFDTFVTRINTEEAVNLKKLAKVYATMSPEGAARIIKEMDEIQIVKILALMKESESAPILENLGQGTREDARRAATISNRLRLTISTAKKPTPP